jgi:ubiquinol-cytochrome c reductase cytochrome b/c1 subunit
MARPTGSQQCSATKHIVPQWYFLPFYAILRSIPNKLGGVVLMFGAVFVLFALPWLDTGTVRSARFRPIYRQFIAILVVDTGVLGVVGAHEPVGVWVLIGRLATLYYFFHFLVLLPVLGMVERTLPLPASISLAVLPRERRPASVGVHGEAVEYPRSGEPRQRQ